MINWITRLFQPVHKRDQITQQALANAGWLKTHWNLHYNGGWIEYLQDRNRNATIAVSFGEYPEYPVVA